MALTHSTPPLPPGVTLEHRYGRPALVIDAAEARAVLHLDGAQLVSWIPAGQEEVLWTSDLSGYGAGAAIRGGVPLVGPWFGPGRHGDKPIKHGWIRNHPWELRSACFDGEDALLELSLDGADPDGTGIRADARFRIGKELSIDLTLTAGPTEVEVEAALHTYLAVGDVRQVELRSLQGADYLDNTRGLAQFRQEEPELMMNGPTDRVYAVASEVEIVDRAADRRVVSTPRGTAQTVVWNPWSQGAAGMDDIADDAWSDFVCVEPAVAKNSAAMLPPGGALSIGVSYRIDS